MVLSVVPMTTCYTACPLSPLGFMASADEPADELAKRRLVAERVKVAVLVRNVTETRPALAGERKVTDRVLVASGECLAAGKVVEGSCVVTPSSVSRAPLITAS
jgi:hypothetical protein